MCCTKAFLINISPAARSVIERPSLVMTGTAILIMEIPRQLRDDP